MVEIELEQSTLAMLTAGLYCSFHNVDSMAIPENIWISVAEKLEYFLPNWNYEIVSFEDWIKNNLNIYPKALYTEEELKHLQETTLYSEVPNGNAILVISMDIRGVNAKPK